MEQMTLEAYLAEIRKRLEDATPKPGVLSEEEQDVVYRHMVEMMYRIPSDLARLVKIIEVQWQALECDQREHLVMGICEHCEARAAVEKIVNENNEEKK